MVFFLFKQKTAYEMRISDWSSDVCSSDLDVDEAHQHRQLQAFFRQALRQLVEVDRDIRFFAEWPYQHVAARCHVEIAFAPLRDVVELACLPGRPARRGHRIVIHFVLSPDILAGPGQRSRLRGALVESPPASAHAWALRTPPNHTTF